MNSTVSAKGQITLPRFMREVLGLKSGAKLSLSLGDGELRLRPAPIGTARRLAGSLRRYGRPGTLKSIREHTKSRAARAAASTAPP